MSKRTAAAPVKQVLRRSGADAKNLALKAALEEATSAAADSVEEEETADFLPKVSEVFPEIVKSIPEDVIEVEEDEPCVVVMPTQVDFVRTVNGPCMILNGDIVGQKLIDIVAYILSDPEQTFIQCVKGIRQGHGIHIMDFRTDDTVGRFTDVWEGTQWYYWVGARAAGCNVRRCVTDAFKKAIGSGAHKHAKYQNIEHAVYQFILQGMLHEVHHAQTVTDNFIKILSDAEFREKEERSANVFSKKALFELAKQIEIEPVLTDKIRMMIKEEWDALGIDESKDPDVLEFVKCQEYMQNTGDSWCVLSKDHDRGHQIFNTYREFLFHSSGEDDIEPWKKPVPSATVACKALITADNFQQQAQQAIPEAEPAVVNSAFNGMNGEGWISEGDDDDDFSYDPDDDDYTSAYTPQVQMQQPVQQQQVQQPEYTYQVQQPVQQQVQQPEYTYQVQQPVQQQVNPNVQVGAGTYERPNMTPDVYQATINGLYKKIYRHIMLGCQFNPYVQPGAIAFNNPEAIKQPIPLEPNELMIVKEMDAFVQVGGQEQMQLNVPVSGWLSGRYIDRERTLPGYVIAWTDLNGNRVVRKFLPQNIWNKKKEDQTQWSGTAVMGQQGHRIIWVLDPMSKENFDRRLINGVFEMRIGRDWVTKQVIINRDNNNTPQERAYLDNAARLGFIVQ